MVAAGAVHHCAGPESSAWWQCDEGLRFATACRQIAFITGEAVGAVQYRVLDAYRNAFLEELYDHAQWAERVRDAAMRRQAAGG